MNLTPVMAGIVVAAGLFTLTGCTGASPGAGSSSSAVPAGPVSSSPSISSPGSTSSPGTSPTATAATMSIKNFAYQLPSSVAPGTKITISNADSSNHTVTSDSGNAFNVTVPGGGSATLTAPMTPGRYPFHCVYHGNMHGVLVVKGTP
jgi:plastocyanin